MVTFENGKNYSIQFEILNNGPIFESTQIEKNTICTALIQNSGTENHSIAVYPGYTYT